MGLKYSVDSNICDEMHIDNGVSDNNAIDKKMNDMRISEPVFMSQKQMQQLMSYSR